VPVGDVADDADVDEPADLDRATSTEVTKHA
jgi:hypothetical protein